MPAPVLRVLQRNASAYEAPDESACSEASPDAGSQRARKLICSCALAGKGQPIEASSPADRLRCSFEELGPYFFKTFLGNIACTPLVPSTTCVMMRFIAALDAM